MIMLNGILMMVIHPMLLPLIDEQLPQATTIATIDSPIWLAQRPKCYNIFEEYVAEIPYNPELFEDIPDLAEDWY